MIGVFRADIKTNKTKYHSKLANFKHGDILRLKVKERNTM